MSMGEGLLYTIRDGPPEDQLKRAACGFEGLVSRNVTARKKRVRDTASSLCAPNVYPLTVKDPAKVVCIASFLES